MNIFDTKAPYVYVTAFYAISLMEFDMEFHSHKSCEIMYVDKGSCRVYVGEEEYHLEKGNFVLIEGGLEHRLWIPKGTLCSLLNLEWCNLREKSFIDLRDPFSQSNHFVSLVRDKKRVIIGEDIQNLGFALKDLISNLQKDQRNREYLTSLLFYRMILELSWNLYDDHKVTGAHYLKKACIFIEEHLTEEISIPMIAAAAGINKSYLQALFKKDKKVSMNQYINEQRLKKAIYLLINSSLSITDIAFHAGYNSRQHFGNTFEKNIGMSPRAYRQIHGRALSPSTQGGQYFRQTDGSWDVVRLKE